MVRGGGKIDPRNATPPSSIEATMSASIEQIPLKAIDGAPSSLGTYKGKVRLVVNVASKCGLTPQYAGLEALYTRYKDRGFEILGFPANEFGSQEPGTNAEIQQFCSSTYQVTFPMFEKIVVKGAGQHPLYAALTDAQPQARALPGSDFRQKLIGYGVNPGEPKEILWNFEKFLVDRSGRVVERFAPDVPPDADILTAAIERELGR
jgi:glutathione peroxidase